MPSVFASGRFTATHVQVSALDAASLGRINAYNPGLSGAWMLQRAMSVRPGAPPAADFINRLLGQNFAAMERMGDPVLRPFLQVGHMTGFSQGLGRPGRAICGQSRDPETLRQSGTC